MLLSSVLRRARNESLRMNENAYSLSHEPLMKNEINIFAMGIALPQVKRIVIPWSEGILANRRHEAFF